MKELRFKKQDSQLGEIKILMRIDGKIIYLKTNNSQYSEQMLQQLSSKGATILKGRGWLRINLFKPEQEDIKLGSHEFNLKEDPEEIIETSVANFYSEQYLKAGFNIE